MRASAAWLVVVALIGIPGPGTISSAAQSDAAAQGWFDLPVTGGRPTLERLGILPEEQATALILLARALHGASSASTNGSLAVTFTEIFGAITTPVPLPVPAGDAEVILAPFSDATWRRVLNLDRSADLFPALTRQRGALLVASGALLATPGARRWLSGETALLQTIVKEHAGSFAVAAPALAVEDGHVLTPGGSALEPAWTSLVGVGPDRAGPFIRRVLERDEGRLARFYAMVAHADPATLTAMVPTSAGDGALETLSRLYALAREAEPVWAPNGHPFQLTYADLPSVLRAFDGLDRAALPANAGLWPELLRAEIESPADAADLLTRTPARAPFAATVQALLDGSPRERRDRIAVLSLARRLWSPSAPQEEQAHTIYALGHYRRFRALLLTLDRLNVTTPHTWVAAVNGARRVDSGGGRERGEHLALYQAALAIVERARRVGSLSAEDTDRAITALAAGIEGTDDITRGVSRWLLETLMPALPPLVRPDRFTRSTAYESRVLQALGGFSEGQRRTIEWEGIAYTVDVPAAEHERILRIRSLVPTPGLDAALDSGRRAEMAQALTSLVYAAALGDPDGPVTLSPDVVLRHDFGIGARASFGREYAWQVPQERTGSGQPWHVSGSMLGLDLAFARIALRRMSLDDMPPIPTINLNDQLTLARTAVALESSRLVDADRDRLADAISRGRQRVAAASGNLAALTALADEVAMGAPSRRTLAWTFARDKAAPARLFGLRDFLWLGRDGLDVATLAPWGVLGETVDGRLVLRFEQPLPWDVLAGRPDTGVLATQVPDVTLRLAEETARRQLPAALIPALLLYATQDYWHEVEARFADDWPAMVRGAAAIKSSQIEDYVAALGSSGPLRPR